MNNNIYDKVMVPLDGSSLAESVLPWVEQLAKQLGSEVILTMVAELPPERFGTSPGFHLAPVLEVGSPEQAKREEVNPSAHREYLEQHLEHLEEEIKQYLTPLERRLKKLGINTKSVVLFGHAAEQIVDYAKDSGVDIIAMATHGRSGVGRWVFGSVAEKVLRAATVPVLLIRAPRAA